MTGQIVGDTEWNGLPMPRRLWAILAVTFGVALSVLDGTIANVALPTIAHRAGSLVGRFDLGGQCLSAGDRRFAAEFFDAGRCRRLPPHLHRRTRLLHPLVGRLRFCRLAGNADRHAGDSGIRRCGCGEYQYVDHPYHLPARPVGARHGINATVVAIASVAGPTLAAAILSMASWHWLFAINIPDRHAAVWLSMRFCRTIPSGSPTVASTGATA